MNKKFIIFISMSEADNTTQQIKKSLQDTHVNPATKNVFDSLVQNFAH